MEGGQWLYGQEDLSRDYTTWLGAWESWDEVFFSWASPPLCKMTVGEQYAGLHAQSEFTPSEGTAGIVAYHKSTLNQPLELTSN